MSPDQIISILRRPTHKFDSSHILKEWTDLSNGLFLELDPDQDQLYTAFLKTIPRNVLARISEQLARDSSCPASLTHRVEWMSEGHPRKAVPKNEPVRTLMRYYLDKKSKKVRYAGEALKDRFEKQSYRDQNSILKAFLMGSATDVDWAARILRDNWRKELRSPVSEAWHRTKRTTLSFVILRHFPDEFILQESEALIEIAGYPNVCARIGNYPSFHVDESRLDTPNYFYVMANLGRKVEVDEMERRFYDYLINYEYNYSELVHKPISLLSISGMRKIIWAMGELGMQDALVRLLEVVNDVKEQVAPNGEYSSELWPNYVAALKDRLDLPVPDRLEKEKEAFDAIFEPVQYELLPYEL